MKWKPAPGLESIGQVSSNGHFKYFKRSWIAGKGRQCTHPEIITKGNLDSKGYSQICISKNSKSKTYTLHRLIAKAFIPNPKRKKTVNHIDGNKLNNRVSNLEWATYGENQKHAYKLGLRRSDGENNGNNKLTKKEVLKIRKLRSFISLKDIAKKYKVNRVTIGDICNNKSWKNII